MSDPYWTDGQVEIWHGDSQSVVPTLFATMPACPWHYVTDPPYGIGLDYGETVDNWRPDRNYWRMLRRCAWYGSTLHMTVSNRHLDYWMREVIEAGWNYLHTSVYWNQGRAGGNANGQFAYAWEPMLHFTRDYDQPFRTSKRMMSDVYQHHGRRDTTHPAERDLGSWRLFISHLPDGLIVDPFLGSGTTLRAALDLGRNAIGIEREEKWCRHAALRCSQMSLFAGDVSISPNAVSQIEIGEDPEAL